jgi:DNA repair protein RecO (recombination protein O)
MAVLTTRAFVLRTFPHKESDLVVRLFSEDLGKLPGIARGARRPRSALTGRLEILSLGEVKGFRSPGREMCSVDAVSPLEAWPRLRATLEGFYRVHYVAELLDTAFAEEEPHPGFFALTQALLTLLEHEALDPDLGLRYLELQLLDELGYGLSFGECVACHAPSPAPAGFEPGEGGFVCAGCLRRLPEALRLHGGLAGLLESLASAPIGKLPDVAVPAALHRPLRELCHRLLLYRLERPLRSARYLDELDREA